jgi:DNA-binding NtrC family response regulator
MRGDRRADRAKLPPHIGDVSPAPDDPRWDAAPSAPDPHRLSLLLESFNPTTLHAIATARRAAAFEVPVLLTGETGTGKSVLAAAMHGWSQRTKGPFVTVSCRAPEKTRREPMIPREDLAIESVDDERWAHPAPHGTLFLDEVGMLSGAAQAKLIRFLEDDRCDAPRIKDAADASTRVIAATSRELDDDVAAGRFRRDLFFRLNVVTIHLPALRERREDIPQLTAMIVAEACARHHRQPVRLATEVRTVLGAYDWRGNLRELATVLEHAVVLATTNTIALTDLPERMLVASSS